MCEWLYSVGFGLVYVISSSIIEPTLVNLISDVMYKNVEMSENSPHGLWMTSDSEE